MDIEFKRILAEIKQLKSRRKLSLEKGRVLEYNYMCAAKKDYVI